MGNGITIGTKVQKTQAPQRDGLPPLTPYNVYSQWVIVDAETGEADLNTVRTMAHPIGKVGAGLNAAFDRILKSFADRDFKGYNDLEGYTFAGLVLDPVAD